ncbi:hypothetical protein H1R20_g13, partial [Candolleomyces eurysporus]
MGPTGVGKSTFINKFCGENVVAVSDLMESCTQQIAFTTRTLADDHPLWPGHRLVLVDTPGFDDTYLPDHEILRRISVWLARVYDNDTMITGLVYLHNITQKRMLGSTRTNYEMFQKLCGANAMSRVVMATTHWDMVQSSADSQRAGEVREDELKNFWAEILSHGAQIMRVQAPEQDTHNIVESILENHAKQVVTKIQQELVDMGLSIPETEAGQHLRYTLQEYLDLHKKLRPDGDPEIREKEEQLKKLNVDNSFFSRVKDLFRLKKGGKNLQVYPTKSSHN